MSYLDRLGFMHDKKCVNGKASSNNPAIYSAYNQELTFQGIDFSVFEEMFSINYPEPTFTLIRHPDNKTLETSLDEIVGWIYLGYLSSDLLSKFKWRYSDQNHNPSTWKIIKAMIYISGEDRNFYQDNNVRDAHPITSWIPWYLQYYSLKKDNKAVQLKHIVHFYLFFISTVIKPNFKMGAVTLKGTKIYIKDKQTGNISTKNILWLILRDLDSKFLIRFIDYKKNFKDYFGKRHPLGNS